MVKYKACMFGLMVITANVYGIGSEDFKDLERSVVEVAKPLRKYVRHMLANIDDCKKMSGALTLAMIFPIGMHYIVQYLANNDQ
jgi:hypothetical protein